MASSSQVLQRFDQRAVNAAQPRVDRKGKPRAALYRDGKLPGFGLIVYPSGQRSFYVMRRVHGRRVRYVFAPYANGQPSVQYARTQAAELLVDMRKGVDPIKAQRDARTEAQRAAAKGITLRQALDLYAAYARNVERAPRTLKDAIYLLHKYLSQWLDRALVTLDPAEVRLRHAGIAAEIAGRHKNGSGKLTANRVMRVLRGVYNRARRDKPRDLDPTNPTISVNWYKERRREARVFNADLRGWYRRITAEANTVRRDWWLVALFTGLRKQNVAEMRWADVDWERRVLRVPAPKSQKPFSLPLSDHLLDLLQQRKADNAEQYPESPWVFPAAFTIEKSTARKAGAGHIVAVRVKGLDYRPHDMRRTYISVAAELPSVPVEARKLLVDHAAGRDVHSRYVVQDPELTMLRTYQQHITDRLLALCNPAPTHGKVLPLKRAATRAAR